MKIIAIALMILLPLAWGLLVEWLFELRRRLATGNRHGREAGVGE